MKKFFRFFISKQFLLNLAGIILAWVLVVWIESLYLDSHTNHGQKIEVPSFYKIHMDDLDEFIAGKNIKYEIQDSVYLDDWPKGTVCWQYPRPTDSTGMYVKEDRVISLSVVPIRPKMIAMPKVVDMSKRMAENILSSLGIRTKISYEANPIGPDFVLKQLYKGQPIEPGMFVPKGSRIELVVSKGNSGEATPLPNLVGLTIKEARERLATLTLSIYPECETCLTEEDFENAVILSQSPAGGENVNVSAGSTITVWGVKSGGGE